MNVAYKAKKRSVNRSKKEIKKEEKNADKEGIGGSNPLSKTILKRKKQRRVEKAEAFQ